MLNCILAPSGINQAFILPVIVPFCLSGIILSHHGPQGEIQHCCTMVHGWYGPRDSSPLLWSQQWAEAGGHVQHLTKKGAERGASEIYCKQIKQFWLWANGILKYVAPCFVCTGNTRPANFQPHVLIKRVMFDNYFFPFCCVAVCYFSWNDNKVIFNLESSEQRLLTSKRWPEEKLLMLSLGVRLMVTAYNRDWLNF